MATQPETATFNGSQPTSGTLPYVDIAWPTAYATAAAYRVVVGPNVTDGNGTIVINFTNKTNGGVRVLASDQFIGTVELIAVDI